MHGIFGVFVSIAMAGLVPDFRLLALRDITACAAFSGSDDDRDDWSHSMRALFGSLGWRDLIAQTEAHPDVLTQEDGGMGPEAQQISANLYLFLSMKVRGKGAAIVRLVADGCGLESWRK